jgi:hypothetical protein
LFMSGQSPADSAIRVSKTLEEKIAAATSQAEIETLMHDAARAQQLVRPDLFDETILIPVDPSERSAAPQRFTKTVTIDGTFHTINGNSAEDLSAAEVALYREVFSQPSDATNRTEPARDSQTGRFLPAPEPEQSDADLARETALEIQFRNGSITMAEFIEKSGAIERYEARRETQQIIGGWQESVSEFLNSPAGADWPGGTDMMKRIGEVLQEKMGVEREPSAENLARAWAIIKQEDFEKSIRKQAETTNDPYELRNRLQPGRSLFDR